MALPVLAGLSLALPARASAEAGATCDARWTDPARRNRVIPVRIRMPAGKGRTPAILFSHGLGGSLDSGRAWAEAWTEAGFLVINVQHEGSDRAIIGKGRLRDAVRPEQLIARARDIGFVIDRLARGVRAGACDLGRADPRRIGMSGHSYGAHTAQAVAGQHLPFAPGGTLRDPRIRAAVAFSPAPPARGSAQEAFAPIAIPFLSVTGTADSAPITPWIRPAERETPFRAMPPGGKYLLVLAGADHMAFNGRGDHARAARALTPHVETVVIRATIAFWRWSLMGDARARNGLDSAALALSDADRIERK